MFLSGASLCGHVNWIWADHVMWLTLFLFFFLCVQSFFDKQVSKTMVAWDSPWKQGQANNKKKLWQLRLFSKIANLGPQCLVRGSKLPPDFTTGWAPGSHEEKTVTDVRRDCVLGLVSRIKLLAGFKNQTSLWPERNWELVRLEQKDKLVSQVCPWIAWFISLEAANKAVQAWSGHRERGKGLSGLH